MHPRESIYLSAKFPRAGCPCRFASVWDSMNKLISGGQTGADRAALDVALRYGFPHGGWCPKGRKAEDGAIGGQYQLSETPSDDYAQRTEWNVRDSDATVVFTLSGVPRGGSLLTVELAKKHGKPCLHLSPVFKYVSATELKKFVGDHAIKVLNVAGSRESEEPGLWRWVYGVLENAFFWHHAHPGMIGGPGEG